MSSFQYPHPFDTSLGGNFTDPSCPNFFEKFLADQAFVQCYPMSFYLQNSQSYVVLVRKQGMAGVEHVLDTACSTDMEQCQQIMNAYATELLQPSNCRADYNYQNPLVTQAYQDFITYTMIREATCLPLSVNATSSSKKKSTIQQKKVTNQTSPTYCYTDALFNSADVSDAYLYLLPYGIAFPNNSVPSCSPCTQQVMSYFHNYTGNATYQISYTYESASNIINSDCSQNFVNASSKPLPTTSLSKKNAASRPAPLFSVYHAMLLILCLSLSN